MCGQSFASSKVTDSTGGSVSHATVELLAELGYKDYEKFYDAYGHKEPGTQLLPFKIPSSVAQEIIKLSAPLSQQGDFCGNTLKQTARETVVKTMADRVNNLVGSKENFGFCLSETFSTRFLLKISARGYLTDFYIGPYLGGCHKAWYFVLEKGKDR